jgi:hypothetical protein
MLRFGDAGVESTEGARLRVPLSLAVQLLLFVPQFKLQSDWAEEWLQMFKEILFRHAHVPVEKKQ